MHILLQSTRLRGRYENSASSRKSRDSWPGGNLSCGVGRSRAPGGGSDPGERGGESGRRRPLRGDSSVEKHPSGVSSRLNRQHFHPKCGGYLDKPASCVIHKRLLNQRAFDGISTRSLTGLSYAPEVGRVNQALGEFGRCDSAVRCFTPWVCVFPNASRIGVYGSRWPAGLIPTTVRPATPPNLDPPCLQSTLLTSVQA